MLDGRSSSGRGFLNCSGSRLGRKGDWRSAASSGISSGGSSGGTTRHLAGCKGESCSGANGAKRMPSGFGGDVGRLASALEKRWGRSITAAFGFQGAHAESAEGVKTTPQKTRFRNVNLYKEFAYRSKIE